MKSSKIIAEHYTWGDGCDGWHLVKTENMSVIQEKVPSGKQEVKHFHRRSNQYFFCLSGEATLEVEGIVHTLRPREGLYVPAGKAHQLRNEGPDLLEFLVISSPKSHGDRVDLK